MGFAICKAKGSQSIAADKDTSSQLSGYTSKTTGPAIAKAFKGGSGTYAEKGGRALASSRDDSAWSMSIAYGGDSDDERRDSRQVSSRKYYTYTSGNASAGVIKGGTFAQAGPGGYGEAVYHDGSEFSASVAYGKEIKKDNGIRFTYDGLGPLGKSSNQRGRIEPRYPSSDEEGDDSDDDEGYYYS